jgi:site-specific DNA recombinase
MDDLTAGPRIRDLRDRLTQLHARRDDLADNLTAEPALPPPDTIERLRAHLAHTIAEGTSGERKRIIEALIAEIRITSDGQIIPVFKIPTSATNVVPHGSNAAVPPNGSRNGEVGGPPGTRTPNLWIKSPQLCH